MNLNPANDSGTADKSGIAINKSSPKNAAALAAVHDRSWADYFRHAGRPYEAPANIPLQEREKYWHDQLLIAESRDLSVFQAVNEGSVVGFIAARAFRRDNVACIKLLCVEPEHRRQHVATELLQHIVNHMRDMGFYKLFVWIMNDDINSCRFYEGASFKPDGAYRKYPGIPQQTRYTVSLDPW
jgi:GNAT superfamily N-acetyltransferase